METVIFAAMLASVFLVLIFLAEALRYNQEEPDYPYSYDDDTEEIPREVDPRP